MAHNSEENVRTRTGSKSSPPRAARKTVKKKSAGSAEKVLRNLAEKTTEKTAKKVVKKAVKKAAGKTEVKVRRKSPGPGIEKITPAGDHMPIEKIHKEPEFRLPSRDPEIRKLLEELVQFLEEKKIENLRVMDLEEVNPYFCFFIIVTATSGMQLQAIAREISKRFGEHLQNKRVRPLDLESGWVIQDFVDIVLHIFLREEREYYNLEKLWGDAPTIYSSEEPRFRWPQTGTDREG